MTDIVSEVYGPTNFGKGVDSWTRLGGWNYWVSLLAGVYIYAMPGLRIVCTRVIQ